jgi:hypothetical protein
MEVSAESSIYRWLHRANRPQTGGGEAIERLLLLQGFEVKGAAGAE